MLLKCNDNVLNRVACDSHQRLVGDERNLGQAERARAQQIQRINQMSRTRSKTWYGTASKFTNFRRWGQIPWRASQADRIHMGNARYHRYAAFRLSADQYQSAVTTLFLICLLDWKTLYGPTSIISVLLIFSKNCTYTRHHTSYSWHWWTPTMDARDRVQRSSMSSCLCKVMQRRSSCNYVHQKNNKPRGLNAGIAWRKT